MRRYQETFSRHRVVLVLPVVITLVLSAMIATSAAKKYETTMSLWFDTPAPAASSLQQLPSGDTPASQGQAVLQELLGTSQFLVAVGHRGPLASTLGGGGKAVGADLALDADIAATLRNAFVVTTTGPQVVDITMSGHDPSYMAGTLSAVAAQYVADVAADLQSRDTDSSQYYQAQINAAKAALTAANAAVSAYQAEHPEASFATDPTLTQLTQVAIQDQTNLNSIQTNQSEVSLGGQNVQSPASFHVIDAPSVPIAASRKKHEILIGAAGLVAGSAISLLALVALTGMDKTARSEEDLDGIVDVEVVATISELPARRKVFGLGKATTP